mgnify:CR=1 FL=1
MIWEIRVGLIDVKALGGKCTCRALKEDGCKKIFALQKKLKGLKDQTQASFNFKKYRYTEDDFLKL